MKKAANTPENPEFAAVDSALKRAAKVAHTLARKTKTPCYIWKDGKIVNVAERRAEPDTRQE
ncbi:MAG: hypothetical protein A2505_00560 [Deltaproteobacteria bacterium RIFOXYD12_FULL_55_16]|nr:MAG: hypothetical protein A2505_00560 [Deltaproteobacteria bacterium RIFOXYD12_FULL_55_16]